MHGYTLCSKHMHQLLKFGYFKDNNPRTQQDLNGFKRIDKNTIEFEVYDTNSNVNGHFIIDACDLEKIQYHKWRKDANDRIITGNCTNKNPRRELSRFLLGTTNPDIKVDHKDGNPFNNRRSNLRECTQSENLCNRSFMSNNTSSVIGVTWDKTRERWTPEIGKDGKRCHLARYGKFEEAVFARYIAEILLFQSFQHEPTKEKLEQITTNIPEQRKTEIKAYVENKLRNKNMID